MPLLEVTTRPHAGRAVVRLRGDLDVASSEDLRLSDTLSIGSDALVDGARRAFYAD